ncbi:MAG: hypothetical protein PVH88_06090 [Ignavibacteria bacterium]|jgi:hypothetical protein
MEKYNLAIAYKWEYDLDFVNMIESIFHNNKLSTYIIHKDNINQVYNSLKNKKLFFDVILDRASDEDESFELITEMFVKLKTTIINSYHLTDLALDKSNLHAKLEINKINVPKTIILPPLDDEPHDFNIDEINIDLFSKPFVIKPGYYSGGGESINLFATKIEDVKKQREFLSDDSFLLQEKIYPKQIFNKRAWFRSFWFFGKIIHTFWDDITHEYHEICEFEKDVIDFKFLDKTVNKLAGISKLDYFSSEFAINNKDEIYLIDYVNDQCDMRLKSKHFDGIPDKVVEEFIFAMMKFVKEHIKR